MSPADEFPFRLAVGVFWLLNTVLRTWFQLKVRREEVVERRNEQRAKLFFRLMALSYVLILFYVLSSWFDFAHFPLPGLARWSAGGGLLVLSLALFWWSHATLGLNWSGLLEIHRRHALVMTGPYRAIRHPMYAAFFLSAVGLLTLSANWLIGGAYLLGVALMYLDRVTAEDQMMMERFGEEYKAYVKRTNRLIPRIRFGSPQAHQ